MTQLSATEILFCHNTWQSNSIVKLIKETEQGKWVVTKETPFHPVSHIWPDHPEDKGVLQINNVEYPVLTCQTGAIELSTGELYIGKDIPIKRGEEGWVFVVSHLISKDADIAVENTVELKVDKEYQDSLSRGHSAGHIAYLALNKVLHANYWRKDADRKDELGHYNFNSYAQETSFVTEDHCEDVYRLGKTLRKRGLNSAEMMSDLESIAAQVNQQISVWLALENEVSIECEGKALTDSRYWIADFGIDGVAKLPCGGTHVSSFKEYQEINVQLNAQGEQELLMLTRSTKRV
ncbi:MULTISPECIES: alanyl-tRNA editing protein [Aliivibrio]|uniref:Alanyl-tRNA editing protein n=1 Tax=Aliivibrio finisterrensis TaxID=511998 RepID=A0A4Q5KWA9_9GAMM|nr:MULTISPECIES: alanyl-tRNA editing protein [Aliivibrio]MDD9178600.1 alanyl-tRNA editing protein [Aliivibrio sp. A6]RYU53099.1 alanyl-tRNA editing protein [Aliivibrio finisterrensis]RYU55341.1 alanyl-tRNA editing protein [Aliivibrio finisterrensis]RYU60128.1 alanyl-tRNA editing protein [Aliivibrio finisterrensis]RYU63468.1 alanyl-tRNA editing protein [Aliivibrio finisterrensis]